MYVALPYLKIARKKDTNFTSGWGFDAYSFINSYTNIPGQVFSVVFSSSNGLQPGNTISFGTFRTSTEFITELKCAWARSFSVSTTFRNHELFNRAQLGIGITHRLGHAFYAIEADTLVIDYKKRGVMNLQGDIAIKSSGINENGTISDISINGTGFELSGGVILQNDYVSLSGNISNIGLMGWFKQNNVSKVHIAKDSVFLYDVLTGSDDSLITITSYKPRQIRYGLSPSIAGLASVKFPVNEQYHALSTYHLFSLGFNASSRHIGAFGQGITLSFDIENGIDYGKIPFRM
jgi:hypothetical protein